MKTFFHFDTVKILTHPLSILLGGAEFETHITPQVTCRLIFFYSELYVVFIEDNLEAEFNDQ